MADVAPRRFSKADVLDVFQRQNLAYHLALHASQILQSENNSYGTVSATARRTSMGFGDHRLSGDELAAKLDGNEREGLWSEFTLVQLHALIQLPLEALDDYCKSMNQTERLKAAPWYWFAKHIRNAVAHNRHFHFRNHAAKQLPTRWEDVEIQENMQGKPLMPEHLWHQNGYRLFVVMRRFAESLPD